MGEHVQLVSFLSKDALGELSRVRFDRVYEPMKWSFGRAKVPAFVKSVGFARIIGDAAGVCVRVKDVELLRFDQGDYTVLYDAQKPQKGFVFVLDLHDVDESWGGYTSFVKGDGEVVRVVPRRNTLWLIRAKGLRFFTKFVNRHAQHPRVCLIGVAVPK